MSRPKHSLDPLFGPQTVALIGASASAGTVGNIIIRNLLQNPFGGIVYPVNPNRRAVHGVRCFPRVGDIPDSIDLAIVATPAATVPDIIRQCVDKQVRAAIIISSGFSEIGDEGRELEEQIRRIATGKMRILGPNCLGLMHPPMNLNASMAAEMARPGKVALLSQSGAICTSILDWAKRRNLGFSMFVSVGTMIDVDFGDLIDYLDDHPQTSSILIYMEAMGNVRKFLSAARAVGRTKPIIVVKAGRNDISARAAASHVGAMTGSDAVFDCAFSRAGVLRVQTIRDLFHMAEIVAMQPIPRGPNVAILSNAGGPAVMAVDDLLARGGHLATLAPSTMEALDRILPTHWCRSNPVDLHGDASPERFRQAVEICSKDRGVQGIIVLLTPQAQSDPTETARQLVPLARHGHQPLIAAWLGSDTVQPGRDLMTRAGIPTFDTPEGAVRAFLYLASYRISQSLLYETPSALPEDWQPRREIVKSVFAQARTQRRLLLSEDEAKTVFAAYDIPVTPTRRALTVEEAIQAADEFGYPVVLKVLSPRITHKSDVDGVKLYLHDAAAVARAFAEIRRSMMNEVEDAVGESAFGGVTVQPMVTARGVELIIGSSIDPQFGPVIVFGMGGTLVEVFQDRGLALPPLNRVLARRLMERTQIFRALQGQHGQRPVDVEALEWLLVRFSQLIIDFPEIQEVDINPLLATSAGMFALDGRIILQELASASSQLAILPYPNQYTTTWTMPPKPGSADQPETIIIRVVRPEDEPLVVKLFESYSEHTVRMRFFRLIKELSRDNLIRLSHLDYAREMALVAVHRDAQGPKLLGVSRYYLDPEVEEAEFAVAIADAWQGRGLGRYLLQRLIDVARERGVKRLVGCVLRENVPMRTLAEQVGFSLRDTDDPTILDMVLELS